MSFISQSIWHREDRFGYIFLPRHGIQQRITRTCSSWSCWRYSIQVHICHFQGEGREADKKGIHFNLFQSTQEWCILLAQVQMEVCRKNIFHKCYILCTPPILYSIFRFLPRSSPLHSQCIDQQWASHIFHPWLCSFWNRLSIGRRWSRDSSRSSIDHW